ncbi:MAG: hypothetical protein NVS2B8_15040 [Vulcanimicrobiaceae bacterium]
MKPLAITLAAVFAIIGILYLLGVLQLGTSHPGRHVSHFVLFEVLAALSLVWLRFQSAKPTTPSMR